MDRYTKYFESGVAYLSSMKASLMNGNELVGDAITQFASFESIELEPAEIKLKLMKLAKYEDKLERGELVEVSTIRQRLHGLAYESQEYGHPQIVELDEIDDLLDELSERRVENGN